MGDVSDDLRKRVQWEIRVRGLSVRRAAALGHLSNQAWGSWLNGGNLTNAMRVSVAKAFGWDTDWPENPPLTPRGDDRLAAMERQIRQLVVAVDAMLDAVIALHGGESAALRSAVEALASIRPEQGVHPS